MSTDRQNRCARHVVITGASRGIGLELTRQILAGGDRVTALVRDPASATALSALAKTADGRLRIGACDVATEESVQAVVEALGLNSEPIDVLINNAGVYEDASAELPALDLKKVLTSFDVNAVGPMRVTKALLSGLEKAQKPVVAQITSLMGSIGDNTSGGSYAYRMSKAALNMFNKSFAVDYPKIIAITLHPGWVKTDMGGDEAPTLPDTSARGLLKAIHAATTAQSGRFYDFEGDELPW